MIELMSHIEYMYDPAYTADGRTLFIYLKDDVWTILEDKEPVKITVHPEGILEYLEHDQVDMKLFNDVLVRHVKTEAAYLTMRLEKCVELVGIDNVDGAVAEMKAFERELHKVITKASGRLRIVKDDKL